MLLTNAKKVLLIIMDGVGAAPNSKGNAVTASQPINLIKYWDTYPSTYLKASSEAVGLPFQTNGNSEVGHLNIGAGKVVVQNLPKINQSIERGAYENNQTLKKAFEQAENYKSRIHIMGCLSDGSVHAHTSHFIATLKFFAVRNFQGGLFVHAFTDGRDTPPKSAEKYLQQIQSAMDDLKTGKIASLCGRAFAMDRNETWDRTEKAYKMLTTLEGKRYSSWQEALKTAYDAGQIDEYIEPAIIAQGSETPEVRENDIVIMLNFRGDRAIQMTSCFVDEDFNHFPVKKYKNLLYIGMVEYRKDFPHEAIFKKEYLNLTIGRIISENGLRQLRISESEKFPHVTYFFNGGISVKYPGEDRIEIPSPRIPTYDLQPEMSAVKLMEALTKRIDTDIYNFIVLNIPNGDMVGHTGNLDASMKAVKTVDYCVDYLVKRFTAKGGSVIITADHGNVEEVINLKTGEVDTEHSQNPVPFIVIHPGLDKIRLPYGALSNISPTILHLMGIQKPAEMNGESLLKGIF